jgi:integrase
VALVVADIAPELLARTEAMAARPRSAATADAYRSDWRTFAEWCAGFALQALPASERTIATFLVALRERGRKHSTIARAYASIRAQHVEAGSPLPTLLAVRNVLSNLGRELGTAPRQKAPLMASELKRIARATDENSLGSLRDRALLLIGFAAALRRSEIVALDVSDVRIVEDGAVVTIRKSKTDQAGAGRTVGMAFGSLGSCPVRALRAWLDASGLATGPLFRAVTRAGHMLDARLQGRAVARIVKRSVERHGLDAAEFSGHSLRAGLATSAAKAGKGLDVIMRATGHKSERVARSYVRHGQLFDQTASEGLL